jgi:hypothetical protein
MNHTIRLKLLSSFLCVGLTSACNNQSTQNQPPEAPNKTARTANGRWQLQTVSDPENKWTPEDPSFSPAGLSQTLESFLTRLQSGAILTLDEKSGKISQTLDGACIVSRVITVTPHENQITLAYADSPETFEGNCSDESRTFSFGPASEIVTGFTDHSTPGGLQFKMGNLSLFFATSQENISAQPDVKTSLPAAAATPENQASSATPETTIELAHEEVADSHSLEAASTQGAAPLETPDPLAVRSPEIVPASTVDFQSCSPWFSCATGSTGR